jgi:hypothetical protein
MSAIASNNSSATDNLLALLRSNAGTADASSPSATTGLGAAGSQSETTSGGTPATFVDLSDHAREVLARNNAEQVAAAQLQSFVESRHDGGKGNPGLGSGSNIPASQTTGNEYAAEFGTQDGSMYGVLVTPTEPGSAVATVLPIVTPKISFANQVQAGGFSVSAVGDASNGTYGIEINGPDGFSWTDQQSDSNLGQGVIGGSEPAGGLVTATPGPGNIETITFSVNSAAAESVTASSDSGTVSMSTASAEMVSESVSIDFSTGEIELKGSAASMRSTQLSVSA